MYTKSSTLSLNGAEISNQPLAAFKIDTPPGFHFDGIIGYDFIAGFVVEIDYERKIMMLRDPQSFNYRGRGEVIPLRFNGRKTPLMQVRMKVAGQSAFLAQLEVDSGADGAFLLNGPTVAKRRLLTKFKEVVKGSGRRAGGEQSRLTVRFATASFGRNVIQRPLVSLTLDTEGAGADANLDGLIGGEVLRRFKVIFDYSRRRMILERNSAFNDPFEIESGE